VAWSAFNREYNGSLALRLNATSERCCRTESRLLIRWRNWGARPGYPARIEGDSNFGRIVAEPTQTLFGKKRNRQCRLTLRREVNHYLLVTLWVLFPPQYQK
jgi:hypothetical protein